MVDPESPDPLQALSLKTLLPGEIPQQRPRESISDFHPSDLDHSPARAPALLLTIVILSLQVALTLDAGPLFTSQSFLASPLYWGEPQCRASLSIRDTPVPSKPVISNSAALSCGSVRSRALSGRTTDLLTGRSSPRTSTPPVPRQLQRKTPSVFSDQGLPWGPLFILTSPPSMWDLTCALCSGSSES